MHYRTFFKYSSKQCDVVQIPGFLVPIPCLSTVLICLNMERTRTEVADGWKGEHMEEKSGGLKPDSHRMLKEGRNWWEGRSLEFLRK